MKIRQMNSSNKNENVSPVKRSWNDLKNNAMQSTQSSLISEIRDFAGGIC
jgi:hypothetical protein